MLTPKNQSTPMLEQYREIKKKYADCILFYRMGDFYEMFFEDAVVAAPLLEVQLTSRDKNVKDPIPMCGVPHHAVNHYIEKLLSLGKKVALCEQLEDPALAKGIVKRDVVRVFTPALIADPELVPEQTSCFLLAVIDIDGGFEIALIDLLASRVISGLVGDEPALIDLLLQTEPKELLVSAQNEKSDWLGKTKRYFPNLLVTLRAFPKGTSCLNVLENYVIETQKTDALREAFRNPEPLNMGKFLRLDLTTVQSLGVVRSISEEKQNPSLFSVMDRTVTAMGRRLLREWLVKPLNDVRAIERRLDSVDQLWVKPAMLEGVRDYLKGVRDLERLTTKTALGLSNARDLVIMRETLKRVPLIKSVLGKAKPELLNEIASKMHLLKKLVQKLDEALLEEPSVQLKNGGLIKESYHVEVKKLRELQRDAKKLVEGLEARERKRTGIGNLKVKQSKVFGFTIEITQSHVSKVPKTYIRKQTLANGERFITEELRDLGEKIESADLKLHALEEAIFLELRQEVASHSTQLLQNARLLAELDVLQSLAKAAVEKNLVRPEITTGWDMTIIDGRHPIVEAALPLGEFIPNSLQFREGDIHTWLITGPNMSGKSTIMRQMALIVILSHVGSFVPAGSATIPIIDSVFTRIGSADDLAHGRSTFMVEMTEMARILRSATSKSLILIDEVGRGTSTYDGLSLAIALLEHIHSDLGSKTLFSTHFHELTSLEKTVPLLKNANVLVRHWNKEIIFLHKLVPGICRKSYGVEVAKLAGLPLKVLLRAEKILEQLEMSSQRGIPKSCDASEVNTAQLDFFEGEKGSESRSSIDA